MESNGHGGRESGVVADIEVEIEYGVIEREERERGREREGERERGRERNGESGRGRKGLGGRRS